MTKHTHEWGGVWPDWVPGHVRNYICHVNGDQSLRSLARNEGGHASTVLRQFRQIETAREDLLVDEALNWLIGHFRITVSDDETFNGRQMERPDEAARHTFKQIERDLPMILQRLAKPDAVLAYAPNMDRAVIVRDRDDGDTVRLGVVDRPSALVLALNGWIDRGGGAPAKGKVARYRITPQGRVALNAMIAKAENTASGFAEARGSFHGAPTRRARAMGVADTPVLGLARRRGPGGTPFLGPDLVRAAERIQDDFELAQMEPRVTANWDSFLTAGTSGAPGGSEPALRGAAAARDRVLSALSALGPGLGDVVLECCCRLHGLEAAEKKLGWSARSGKIVLRIALQRLRAHYDGLKDGGGLIG
ncbi:DUF6456 domain-containing protein [Pseudooceanicola onchidii]|uniref:DUF6456 domain-containing protein n=1 Tax=Pseudooceanicola onchidii TaxID=2562279 RepID=UPI0010AB2E70|nr:DUF6456 domain-containing protein [Pseudooceanicola onchidii]